MHPLNVIKLSKEERGWATLLESGWATLFEKGDTNWEEGTSIWFYHNEVGKYNTKPIKGKIIKFIRCQELGNRDIMIVLCENSIERYPVMLDSTYDIIGNTKKDVKNRARLCSTKYQLTKELLR